MIRVKDTYISMDNIKTITHEAFYMPDVHYIVIKYFYDEQPVQIQVDSFEEFETLADMIREIIHAEKNRG